MAKKDTINTTPVPDSPTTAPTDAYTLSTGLKVSNYPYLLIDNNFLTSSISTKKSQKIQKEKLW